MARLYFEEQQRFNQWWVWALIALVFFGTMGPIAYEAIQAKEAYRIAEGNIQLMIISIIFLVVVNAFVVWIVLATCLYTKVDEQGVHYRFPPFINSWRLISKGEINSYEVGKYRPMLDYGGWGLRYGLKGKAVNVRGNEGLKLHYGKDKKLMIGTQKTDDLRVAMAKLMAKTTED
jgi:hypothetical protein